MTLKSVLFYLGKLVIKLPSVAAYRYVALLYVATVRNSQGDRQRKANSNLAIAPRVR